MRVSSPGEFRAAVESYSFVDVSFDSEALAPARSSLATAGLLVVGEPHGVYETPAVLYALAGALGTRGFAFEWSHEELAGALDAFMHEGSFDFERLWSLPASAEFFCGDGRFTTGHFALLQRLLDEGRLDQVIAYDRHDPDPLPDWPVRDREMAERLLAEWDAGVPLLVVTGAFHARDEDGTMASMLARERPGLRPAMLAYEGGPAMPSAPIRFRLQQASDAVLPARL